MLFSARPGGRIPSLIGPCSQSDCPSSCSSRYFVSRRARVLHGATRRIQDHDRRRWRVQRPRPTRIDRPVNRQPVAQRGGLLRGRRGGRCVPRTISRAASSARPRRCRAPRRRRSEPDRRRPGSAAGPASSLPGTPRRPRPLGRSCRAGSRSSRRLGSSRSARPGRARPSPPARRREQTDHHPNAELRHPVALRGVGERADREARLDPGQVGLRNSRRTGRRVGSARHHSLLGTFRPRGLQDDSPGGQSAR